MTRFAGIDFGAKTAGTTVICMELDGHLHFFQSGVREDADIFIQGILSQYRPSQVFIDAPLSLPGAYTGLSGDFMYRECDRICRAMSPMFLGGLTARAMQLKNLLSEPGVRFFEVYPTALADELKLAKVIYDKKSPQALKEFGQWVMDYSPVGLKHSPENWHQADSWLAWYTGWRYQEGLALSIGNPEEGLIWI